MVKGKKELLSALVDAYIMEKETSNYYHVASRRANEWDAKAAFRELAGLKQVHMKYVQFLYGMIQHNGDIISFEDFKKKKDIPADDGWVPVKEIEKHYSFIDDTGILINALEIEAKTHELYRNLSKTTPDNVVKSIFEEMMKQEDSHIDFLKKMPGIQIEE